MKNLLCCAAALLAFSVSPCFAETAQEPAKAVEDSEPVFVAEESETEPADVIPASEPETLPDAKQMNYKRSVRILYVVVTGKDDTALFLAEQVVREGKALVIIVPDSEAQVESSAALEVRLPDGTAFSLETAKLSRFLAFLRPRNVILLGSDAVLPKIFALSVPSYCTKLNVDDISWKVNATKLDNILNTKHKVYQKYLAFFNSEMAEALKKAKTQEHEFVPGTEPAGAPTEPVVSTEDDIEFKESGEDQIPDNIPSMNKK